MTLKTITKQKSNLICDICGEEIDLGDTRDVLSLSIRTSWWQTFNMKNYDICKKHKKSFLKWLKKEKNKK